MTNWRETRGYIEWFFFIVLQGPRSSNGCRLVIPGWPVFKQRKRFSSRQLWREGINMKIPWIQALLVPFMFIYLFACLSISEFLLIYKIFQNCVVFSCIKCLVCGMWYLIDVGCHRHAVHGKIIWGGLLVCLFRNSLSREINIRINNSSKNI